jgi:hypothetical protein
MFQTTKQFSWRLPIVLSMIKRRMKTTKPPVAAAMVVFMATWAASIPSPVATREACRRGATFVMCVSFIKPQKHAEKSKKTIYLVKFSTCQYIFGG